MLIARPVAGQIPRNPQQHAGIGHREALGHHADDPERPAVEDDGSADNVGIRAEVPLPQRIGNHRHWIRTDRSSGAGELRTAGLFVAERATEERRDTQYRKEVAAHLRGDQHFGVRVATERPSQTVVARDSIEPGRPEAPVVDVAAGRPRTLDAQLWVGVEDPNELLGVIVRKRPKQDAADQREQDRAHRDTDPYRRDRQ